MFTECAGELCTDPLMSSLCTEEYSSVYDFNKILNSGTVVAKHMTVSMKFAFVKMPTHACMLH